MPLLACTYHGKPLAVLCAMLERGAKSRSECGSQSMQCPLRMYPRSWSYRMLGWSEPTNMQMQTSLVSTFASDAQVFNRACERGTEQCLGMYRALWTSYWSKARHLCRSLWCPFPCSFMASAVPPSTCRLAKRIRPPARRLLRADRAAAVREGGERARERRDFLPGLYSIRAMVPLEGRSDTRGQQRTDVHSTTVLTRGGEGGRSDPPAVSVHHESVFFCLVACSL